MKLDDFVNRLKPRIKQGARVLYAEDDTGTQYIWRKRILEPLGFHVTVVSDGQEALDKLSSESFDLMITDFDMPKVTGTELLNQLRAANSRMPVLFLTGLATLKAINTLNDPHVSVVAKQEIHRLVDEAQWGEEQRDKAVADMEAFFRKAGVSV
ncbi:response regulator [Magnetofaba australis]|uniref:Putative two-component response regulator n=1 Tax=Magnetofaba australis IT-1 TaxID=1434232 RepID=A0A1Y2K8L7_9PROT|nr:response regulator [Magnetofaba australis]OSM06786.1 putative two-component response regulator [Magnetofaba australis IT-1]